ncbi:MAG: hypothetical protein OEM04_11005, partial [Flavobacteriaceae bacterium]|nr:hypothetical protein [Flavobacteriaceae bacterium]
MKNITLILTVAAIAFSTLICKADVSVADIFSDHMVMQRNLNVKVWGNADPGEKLYVNFNGQKLRTKADKNGKWSIILKPMKAGGPFNMTIRGKNEIVLKDILIGDVWVCSGQSNMGMKVIETTNAQKEISEANYPDIRLFTVPNVVSTTPIEKMPNTSWKICTPETIKHFSAAGYYFGRDLHHKINVPIGLIHTSWGGTCVETWTSKASITKLPKYENMGKRIDTYNAEELKAQKKESLLKSIGTLPEKESGLTNNWMLPSTNKDSWKKMNIPTFWGDAGYKYLNGIV